MQYVKQEASHKADPVQLDLVDFINQLKQKELGDYARASYTTARPVTH